MSETSIPILEVANDWPLDKVRTLDNCADAEAVLTEAIAHITGQLTEPNQDPDWARKANFALKMKRQALQAVQRKRGELNTQSRREQALRFERQFVNSVRASHPEVYKATVGAIS